MKKQIIFIVLIGIVITSCKKHKEERTEYLTQDQKNIIDAFKVGDTFTMQKTEIDDNITFIDTITFKVTRAGYRVASNGRWYENGGSETWTETGVVEFKSVNRVLWESGSVNVSGADKSVVSTVIEDINPNRYNKKTSINLNNNIFSNVFLITQISTEYNIYDSAYVSITDGIIKVWDNNATYLKIN